MSIWISISPIFPLVPFRARPCSAHPVMSWRHTEIAWTWFRHMSICINCQPFLSGNPDTRFTTSMGPSSPASKVARAVVCSLATPQSARYISYYFIISCNLLLLHQWFNEDQASDLGHCTPNSTDSTDSSDSRLTFDLVFTLGHDGRWPGNIWHRFLGVQGWPLLLHVAHNMIKAYIATCLKAR